ncbi:MAG: sigma 54-interacting transcriptional regulator [bacterium]
MSANLKMKLRVIDRIGVLAALAIPIAECYLNVIAMEVLKEGSEVDVYLEVETSAQTPSQGDITSRLKRIDNILDVSTVQSLPQEMREKRYQVVLDNISDGILSIDEKGSLVLINRMARRMLNLENSDVIGRELGALGINNDSLLACLQGNPYANEPRNIITANKSHRFLATGKEVRDSSDHVVGAVEVMRDMKEVRELANAVAVDHQPTFNDIIGTSRAMTDVIALALKIADTDGIVSIRGDSGTGKELFAHAIHVKSGRKGRFVPVNCAALPENLLESELFGYVGGSFSGARKSGKAGLFETARDGTIFLDEIGDVPPAIQAKMLRVIQQGMVRRIGGSQEIQVNARVLTATNKNLELMVANQEFREDLYYRINVFPIHIPPLRSRREDIIPLAEHFLFRISSRLGRKVPQLTRAAVEKLCRHDWPGNAREVANVIERAIILGGEGLIDDSAIHFSTTIGQLAPHETVVPEITAGPISLSELLNRYEKSILTEILQLSPSIRQAARKLGISHTALQYKIKKLDIKTE